MRDLATRRYTVISVTGARRSGLGEPGAVAAAAAGVVAAAGTAAAGAAEDAPGLGEDVGSVTENLF